MASLWFLKDILKILHKGSAELPQESRQEFFQFAKELQIKENQQQNNSFGENDDPLTNLYPGMHLSEIICSRNEKILTNKFTKLESNKNQVLQTIKNMMPAGMIMLNKKGNILDSPVELNIYIDKNESNIKEEDLSETDTESEKENIDAINEYTNNLDVEFSMTGKTGTHADSAQLQKEILNLKLDAKVVKSVAKIHIICDQCGDNCLKEQISRHKLVKHGEKHFLCDQCDAKFFFPAHLKGHKESIHDEKFPCLLCKSHPLSKHGLRTHLVRYHTDKTIICDECPFATSENNRLNSHKQKRHTPKDKWPKCNQCDYTTWNKHFLTRHIETYHHGIRIQCKLCPAKFTLQGNLNVHMKTSHKDQLVETGVKGNPLGLPFSLKYLISKD